MIKPYENLEIYNDAYFNEDTLSFSLTTNLTPKVVLLRGIVGSMRIKHTLSQTEFDQTIDYLDLNGQNAGKDTFEKIKDYISEDITIEEVCNVFKDKRFLHQNQHFFESLIHEFNNYYYYENKGSHTTAFTFIYRILEKISYAFPLIYAAKTTDFKGTYEFLKSYLKGDKGELGFFKSFIKVVFKSDPMLENTITLDIFGDTEEIQQTFFDAFKKACPNKNVYDSTDTHEPSRLSIKFIEYSSFIICLRNRFFHLLNSEQPNLQSTDILDADCFFKIVNQKSIYWISLVLIEVLKFNIAKQSAI